jgi:hypothetical protein
MFPKVIGGIKSDFTMPLWIIFIILHQFGLKQNFLFNLPI